MAISQIFLPTHNLSSCKLVSSQNPITILPLHTSFSTRTILPPIRMGGGPRTFPGGVSKWQWKRMQAKKAKQLLKARLAREKQVYEMRKRAELKASVAELERPWEAVEDRAPKLFSVSADEQLKVLADRFHRPGGFDMWSERDGPQLFSPVDGLPSARCFPKGVVHSVKPYGIIGENQSGADILSLPGSFSELEDDVEKNGCKSFDGFGDKVSSGGEIKANSWIESTVNNKERRATDGKYKNKLYKKIGKSSNVVETLSLSSSIYNAADDIERNGYKNFDGVKNSISSEPHTKANKWIKNSRDGNVKIGSDRKVRNNPSQVIGKTFNVAKSSSSRSSVYGVEDDIATNGYKKWGRFRDSLTNEGQTKTNKWAENPMDRNKKFSNDKFRNNHFGKFTGNEIDPDNFSSPRSFSEFEDRVERNGYKDLDTITDSSSRGHFRARQSIQNSTSGIEQSRSNGNIRKKGSSRRLRFMKSNSFNESKGLSSEVYNMDLRDDGSYGFESENC